MPGAATDRFRFGWLFEALLDSENNLFGCFLIETIKLVRDSC